MFILRHGETLWNTQGRMQGGLDSPLTARGRAQARTQGEILRRAGGWGAAALVEPAGPGAGDGAAGLARSADHRRSAAFGAVHGGVAGADL